ncbi:MAG: hypothetical protein HKN07_10745 [Acidimicrobiia bacterium]|nr:hypothetical protein [Acidimicrobiia bacterium]
MPIHAYTMRTDSSKRTILLYGRLDGGPATGISASSADLTAAYVRSTGEVAAIELTEGQPGRWTDGGFVEIDAKLAPGVYQLGLPDAATASGADRAVIVLQAGQAHFDPVDIDLVAFDQQDPHSLGMVALTNEARMSCLSGAFPHLAAWERERLTEVAH